VCVSEREKERVVYNIRAVQVSVWVRERRREGE
jgi:hypothetical protein